MIQTADPGRWRGGKPWREERLLTDSTQLRDDRKPQAQSHERRALQLGDGTEFPLGPALRTAAASSPTHCGFSFSSSLRRARSSGLSWPAANARRCCRTSSGASAADRPSTSPPYFSRKSASILKVSLITTLAHRPVPVCCASI